MTEIELTSKTLSMLNMQTGNNVQFNNSVTSMKCQNRVMGYNEVPQICQKSN